jgi:hypothetical protein
MAAVMHCGMCSGVGAAVTGSVITSLAADNNAVRQLGAASSSSLTGLRLVGKGIGGGCHHQVSCPQLGIGRSRRAPRRGEGKLSSNLAVVAASVETLEKKTDAALVELSINTIRFLAVDAVEKANSGHPGLPMGCAPMGHILYDEVMRYNPKNPYWFNRDRFVLSAGHGCMLQYALLHLAGYDSVLVQTSFHPPIHSLLNSKHPCSSCNSRNLALLEIHFGIDANVRSKKTHPPGEAPGESAQLNFCKQRLSLRDHTILFVLHHFSDWHVVCRLKT